MSKPKHRKNGHQQVPQTVGLVVDLHTVPAADFEQLLVVWPNAALLAKSKVMRYLVAAGSPKYRDCFAALTGTEDAAIDALRVVHARLGDAFHVQGGSTQWLFLVGQELRGKLFDAVRESIAH